MRNNMSITTMLCAFSPITILYVLVAFLILMFMVTVHEGGHYLAGKLLGFKINEFAIGMGPKIFSKKMKSGEDFSIRIFR
jgi:Peptidase family M50.